jgi:hypothetical protein
VKRFPADAAPRPAISSSPHAGVKGAVKEERLAVDIRDFREKRAVSKRGCGQANLGA